MRWAMDVMTAAAPIAAPTSQKRSSALRSGTTTPLGDLLRHRLGELLEGVLRLGVEVERRVGRARPVRAVPGLDLVRLDLARHVPRRPTDQQLAGERGALDDADAGLLAGHPHQVAGLRHQQALRGLRGVTLVTLVLLRRRHAPPPPSPR